MIFACLPVKLFYLFRKVYLHFEVFFVKTVENIMLLANFLCWYCLDECSARALKKDFLKKRSCN